MFRTILASMFLLASTADAGTLKLSDEAIARGIGLNLPLAARLTGAGNVLYTTSIDVSNHTATNARVDFYFDGINLRTQQTITITGMVTDAGLRRRESGTLRARSSAHFEDFVAAMAAAQLLPADAVNDGVLGSVLFVFDGFAKAGQGSVIARFKNTHGGGTVGVSLSAREVTAGEPQRLVAVVRDSRGNGEGEAEVYPNLFVNNMGLTPAGQATNDTVSVELTANSSRTGESIGVPLLLTIPAGQTAGINSVLHSLEVSSEERSVLVTVRVTSGNAAIQGIVSQVDAVTGDGSVFEMSRADF